MGAVPAAAQQTGRIAGRVVQAESSMAVEGAAIGIAGSSIGAVTDAEGRFLLQRVSAGTHTITVSYIGRETQSRQVDVRAGQTTTVEFSSSVSAVVLEAVTVLGARARTQAAALSRQKNAANIMNVVASDQMGRFPDSNAPEAVQRIPGIAIARDQGEGRFIQIRGGAAANTQVNFNGVQVPSPEGDVRQIALDAVPVDILESIEVSKAILPSMDADAVGGAVNLITRRAPAGRLLSVEAAGGFAPIRDEPSGSAAATWGARSDDSRVGLLLNGSWSRRSFGSDDVEPVYDLGGPGLSDDQLEELEVRHYSLSRQRIGATAAFDYRFSETSSIGLTGIFANLTDTEQRRRLISVIEEEALEWQHKNREENLRTYNIAFNGDHLLGEARLDYSMAWTRSLEHTPFDTEINSILEGVSFSPSISDRNNVRSNPSTVSGDYTFDAIEPGSSDTRDTDRVGAINLTLPYHLGNAAGNLRFGFKVRDKTKLQELTEEAYELASGDLVLGSDYGEAWGRPVRHPGEYAMPAFGTSPDQVTGFVSRFRSQLEGEVDIEADSEDYDLDERVVAGYVMTEIDLSPRFMLLPGVRYEHTKVDARGFDFEADTEQLTPTTAGKSYGRVFPMLHARYEVGPRTNLRAAFTTALARPNFFHLVPYRIRDDEDLALGNPDLDPTFSRGFDMLVEHYDQRIGVLSAGIFYKSLTDPIFTFTEDNSLGGETEQPRNGRSGWIRGVEIALQRQIGGGFGIYGNYTFTDSEAELPTGRLARLQGQSDHVFNAALSFERAGLSSQVSLNYQNDYVDEYAEDDFEDVYIDRHLQLDLSATYQVNQRSAIFLELVNLTNEPLVAYQGVRDRPIQMEYYRAWGRFGVRVNR
jgi:TonB-dependent receptor